MYKVLKRANGQALLSCSVIELINTHFGDATGNRQYPLNDSLSLQPLSLCHNTDRVMIQAALLAVTLLLAFFNSREIISICMQRELPGRHRS